MRDNHSDVDGRGQDTQSKMRGTLSCREREAGQRKTGYLFFAKKVVLSPRSILAICVLNLKIFFSLQVFQRWEIEDNEAPLFYLSISTDCTTWSISSSLESRTCYLQSSSAGTSCPAAPSNALNTHAARRSWLFFDSRGNLKEGNIQLFCATHKHFHSQPQANQQHIEIDSSV